MDGLLYFVNYHTRTVEKIIQIHEDRITALVAAPNNQFYVTASEAGVLRIWSTDFESLKSEVNTGNGITHCDVSYDSNQICVLSAQSGTISVLDLDHSNFNVVMRSHMDTVTDLAYNTMTGKLVTVSDDYSVKVWHGDTMEQVNEFISENDKPIRVVS
jgi:WD40 repeat protein